MQGEEAIMKKVPFTTSMILLFMAGFTMQSVADTDSVTTTDSVPVVDTMQSGTQSPAPAYSIKRKEVIVVRETKDTVFVLDKAPITDMVRNWRKNIDILRQRSIGLSGSSVYGVYAVSMAPIEEWVDNHPYLSERYFHFGRFNYQPFLMSGGSGVIGLGDGFRLGGGGMVGRRNFSSDPFHGDSMIVLGAQVAYGGFMVEKAVVSGNWNMVAGGTIGGGSLKVVPTIKQQSSFFTSIDNNSGIDDEDFFDRGNAVEAGYFLFEPHCGFSYTIFHFMHVGLNVSLPVFMSIEKFNSYTSDFISANPGFYLKLVFGNIG